MMKSERNRPSSSCAAESLVEPRWQALQGGKDLAGRRLYFWAETDSTNRLAQELISRGETSALVVAESQSRGRGRLSRQWHSPPGVGIYCSLIYRPRLAPEDLAKLTLAAGLAVALALEKCTGLVPGLKWPNDILLAGKKCGGILCECCLEASAGGVTGVVPGQDPRPGSAMAFASGLDDREGKKGSEARNRPAVVVGIGLNVNTTAAMIPPELQDRATSLRLAANRSWDRGILLEAIIGELDGQVAALEQGRFPSMLAAWRQRDALLGRELDWLTLAGEVVHGTALGPDADGTLQIRDRQGNIHQVMSGDLTLRAFNK